MAISIFGRKRKQPEPGLERGWQFHARPNNLEPVGFVFRIDRHGVRYPVTQLEVESDEGVEAAVKVRQRMEVKVGALARFLQIIDLNADASVGEIDRCSQADCVSCVRSPPTPNAPTILRAQD